MENKWICYLIYSLDTHQTYVGASNRFPTRLFHHNCQRKNVKRKGAKRTAGQTWVPILTISGFQNKNETLSFEAGWKRLAKNRKVRRLDVIKKATGRIYKYESDPKWNRMVDLLYFVYSFSKIGNKFVMTLNSKYPKVPPDTLTLNLFLVSDIQKINWPSFIQIQMVDHLLINSTSKCSGVETSDVY